MSHLINCPACDKSISAQAPTCPACGHPMHPAKPDNTTDNLIKVAGWLGGAWVASRVFKQLLGVIVMIAFFYMLFVMSGR